MTRAKRRFLDRLKRGGPATADELAEATRLTGVAVRQHLAALRQLGLVRSRKRAPAGRGRPAEVWSLTELAHSLFPDRHSELTVGLIDAVRQAVGEEGLNRVVDVRAAEQVATYRARLPSPRASLKRRVESLADLRTAEGYMAEVVPDGAGSYLLIEHHCPICEAATSCIGLCNAELSVFQQAFGPDVSVERTQHLLSGDERCVYRISSAPE